VASGDISSDFVKIHLRTQHITAGRPRQLASSLRSGLRSRTIMILRRGCYYRKVRRGAGCSPCGVASRSLAEDIQAAKRFFDQAETRISRLPGGAQPLPEGYEAKPLPASLHIVNATERSASTSRRSSPFVAT